MSDEASSTQLQTALDQIFVDASAALENCLKAWRACRCSALAQAVKAVSKMAAADRQILPRKANESLQKAWLRASAAQNPSDVPMLIASMVDANRPLAAKRVATFTEWPPDPRIAEALVDGMVRLPLDRQAGRWFHFAAAPAIAAHGDPDGAQILKDIAQKQRLIATRERVAHLAEQLPDAETPSEKLLVLAQQIKDTVARHQADQAEQPGLEAFEAAIYEAPDVMDHRLIYADLLGEIGDPRGEFISLQLGRAPDARPSPRERALIRDHGRDWLGRLAPYFLKGGVEFTGGFVSAARLNDRAVHRTRRWPEWSTLRHLDVSHAGHSAAWLVALPRLQIADGLASWQLGGLVGPTLNVHTLRARRQGFASSLPHELLLLKTPNLRELSFADTFYHPTTDALRALTGSFFGARLERFTARLVDWSTLKGLFAVAAKTKLKHLTFQGLVSMTGSRRRTFSRAHLQADLSGDAPQVTVAADVRRSGMLRDLATAIRYVPPSVSTLTVVLSEAQASDPERPLLDTALERFEGEVIWATPKSRRKKRSRS